MSDRGHLWHQEVITPAVEQVLRLLGSQETIRSFYLTGRRTRRDFIDLYVAAQHHAVETLLELFEKKYAAADYNPVQILKALIYLRDAEFDPLPDLLIPLTWNEVAGFFEREVSRLSHP